MLRETNERLFEQTVRTETLSDTEQSLSNTMREQSAWRKQYPDREQHFEPLWKRRPRFLSVGKERIRLEIAELKALINRNPFQTVRGNLMLDQAQIAKGREDRIRRRLLAGSCKHLRELSRRNIVNAAFNNQLFLNMFFTERYRNNTAYSVTACAVFFVALALIPNPVEQKVEHKLLAALLK